MTFLSNIAKQHRQLKYYNCIGCGKEFEIKWTLQKYCSMQCYQNTRIRKSIHQVICISCGKEFEEKSIVQSRKFCSAKCLYNRIREKTYIIEICQYCGKEFKYYLSGQRRKFCSVSCSDKGHSRKKLQQYK